MATYAELYDLTNDSNLINRTAMAVADIAKDISAEAGTVTNHANRLIWAKQAFQNPRAKAPEMLTVALVSNKGLTPANIQAVTDVNLKTAIAGVVDLFATGS